MATERRGTLAEELRETSGEYEEALYLLRLEYGRLMMSTDAELAAARAAYALAVEHARATGAHLRRLRGEVAAGAAVA